MTEQGSPISLWRRPLLLINRAVKDFVRRGEFVNKFPGAIPFYHLGAAAEQANDSASWETGCLAGSIRIGKSPPRCDTCMTNRHAITGVARRWHISSIVKVISIKLILLPHLPVRPEK